MSQIDNIAPRIREALRWFQRQLSMPSSYHGSVPLYLLAKFGFHARQILKQAKGSLAPSSNDKNLNARLANYRQAIAAGDWDRVLCEALDIADIAEKSGDARLMNDMAGALGRLCSYQRAAQLALAARRIRQGQSDNEWMGQDISGLTLLIEPVENAKASIGNILRHARLIAQAAARAGRCIVLVEPRLVPIFRRSFPGVDIRPESDLSARPEADVVASIDHLRMLFAADKKDIASNFVALKADPVLIDQFRSRYRQTGPGRVIGLSWGSKSFNKDVPNLREWSQFIQTNNGCRFVSLQYGRVDADLARLDNHGRLIHDASVDQLVDMDRFAAQIAALDAVVSISNTAAHLAGALGVPSIVVIDDKFHTVWPVFGDTTPWYPRTQVVLKRGRTWPVVLDDVSKRLAEILGTASASRQA